MLKKLLKNAFLPAFCLHCHIPLHDQLFCHTCANLFEMLNMENHCQSCLKACHTSMCTNCQKMIYWDWHCAAAFEYLGPVQTLVKELKYSGQWYLAKTAAAFMLLQIERLAWDKPDLIIPIPQPFLKKMLRGYNQSGLIAKELADLLDVPVIDALKRQSGNYSQASLSIEQRLQLNPTTIQLRTCDVEDKTVLIIDDVMTTGTTMRLCAETLLQGYPKKLYGLAFSAAVGD